MRTLALIAALVPALTTPAETLREFLKSNRIPETSFSKAELDEGVNGSVASRNEIVLAAYVRLKGELLTGNPHMVRYDGKSGAILRSDIKPEDEDTCCGSPEQIEIAGDFAILSFHINPSAETMVGVGKDLKQVATLYGFNVHEVAPGKIVII